QGALNSTQPLLIGAVVFALSTDYGVFLLTRIKEGHDRGLPNDHAVARGLERTGRIVTAAALLFCVAVGAFASSKIVFIKEIGVGLALGVIIDATLVRGLLVPSLMKLLGDWNWWAPAPLRRFHDRFGLRESVELEPQGAQGDAHAPADARLRQTAATIVTSPARPPSLVVASGPRAGERFEISSEVTLGRQATDIALEDPEVSARHALLRPVDGMVEIADLGSSNGTFVNGARIGATQRLADGDIVQVGGTSLKVEVPVLPDVGASTVIRPTT